MLVTNWETLNAGDKVLLDGDIVEVLDAGLKGDVHNNIADTKIQSSEYVARVKLNNGAYYTVYSDCEELHTV